MNKCLPERRASHRWAWGAAHPRWRPAAGGEHLRLDIHRTGIKLSVLGGPRAVCGGSSPGGIRHPGGYDGNIIPGECGRPRQTYQRGLSCSKSLGGIPTWANIPFSAQQLFVSSLLQKGFKQALILLLFEARKSTQRIDLLSIHSSLPILQIWLINSGLRWELTEEKENHRY